MSKMVANVLPRPFKWIGNEQMIVLDSVAGPRKKHEVIAAEIFTTFWNFPWAMRNHFAFRRLDEWITLGLGSGGCMEPITA